MTTNHAVREAWLQEAIEILRPRFETVGFPVPEKVRVTVGFGPSGARQESKRIMGVCLHKRCTTDEVIEILISPENATTSDMLGTLVHELVHASLNASDDLKWYTHTGAFAEAGTRLGLEGKMASSVPSADLLMELEMISAALGEYPGSPIYLNITVPVEPSGDENTPVEPVRSSSGPKKQTGSRYIKVSCTEDIESACYGYTVRMVQMWLDVGLPVCPNGHTMERA